VQITPILRESCQKQNTGAKSMKRNRDQQSTTSPALSANAEQVLAAATNVSMERNHVCVGTEHLIWGLFNTTGDIPRVVPWIAQQCGLEGSDQEKTAQFKALVEADLNARPLWAAGSGGAATQAPPRSPGLVQVLKVAQQIGASPVRDGDQVLQGGLVASEFIVAALMVHGTTIGCHMIERCSRGQVNARNILQAIEVEPTSILRPEDDHHKWSTEVMPPNATMPAQKPWSDWSTLPDPSTCRGPTVTSNWIIPGRLLIGENPGYYHPSTPKEVEPILEAGITSYVCLIGEHGSMARYLKTYPQQLIAAAGASTLSFTFFAIRDFHTLDSAHLEPFVMELSRRLKAGERIFMHCRGGHGRTGLVLIPVVAALYDISYKNAKAHVCACGTQRESDGVYGGHYPETDAQEALAKDLNPHVRKHIR